MNVRDLQSWLVTHGARDLVIDGAGGPATRAAIMAVFANKNAPAVSADEIAAFADGIGIPAKNLRAIAKVESGGAGYDDDGRPKILFERHYFHRLTAGKWSVTGFSDPKPGGYNQPSWEKLTLAACRNPDAAFASASWGKFQIMGAHAKALGYVSAIEFAWSMVESEAGHYAALAKFITINRLTAAARALSTNPETCRAFASAYNGTGYRKFSYHEQLAGAMQ